MNTTKTIFALKHIVYTLLLLLLYILQTTPGFLAIRGIRPLWVIPAALALAMFEGEFVGGIYGAVAGLLCDVTAVPRQSGGSLLFGFNGLIVTLFCVTAGLLIIYLFRNNVLGCLLFALVTLLVRGSLEFLFAYGMWGHENVWKIYVCYTLPVVLYTLVVTPVVYWVVRGIFRRFGAVQRH